MRGKLLPAAVVAMVALSASALGGCTGDSGPATDGPLRGGAFGSLSGGEDCAPGGQPQTFGDERFTNHGRATVVLDHVALLHPHNEHLIGSYAVPGTLLIGTVPWPPNYADMPPTWKHRQPVRGFQLASGKSFNMVLGVTAIAEGRATSRSIQIYYHDPGGQFVTTNHLAMIIAAAKTGCN
jgi:hypothetical protein